MDSKTTIRPFLESDLQQLAFLHAEMFSEIGETADEVSGLLREASVHTIVATVNDALSGYAIFRKQGNSIYWNWLAVSPPFQNQGMGALLLAEVEEWAHQQNVSRILLDT